MQLFGRPAKPRGLKQKIPAFERRRAKGSLVALLLLFAAFGVTVYVEMQSMRITLHFPMYLFAFPPLAALLWVASFRLSRWNSFRRVHAADGLLCLTCFGDLRSITAAVCPECGKPFTAVAVQTAWRRLEAGK